MAVLAAAAAGEMLDAASVAVPSAMDESATAKRAAAAAVLAFAAFAAQAVGLRWTLPMIETALTEALASCSADVVPLDRRVQHEYCASCSPCSSCHRRHHVVALCHLKRVSRK